MAISSPDIGGLAGGMQAIVEGGAVGGALKSVEVAGPKLGGEIQAAFDGPGGVLGPDIGDFTKGLDAKLDINPGAGIQDIANVNPDVPLSSTPDITSDSSISADKLTAESAGETSESNTAVATEGKDTAPAADAPTTAESVAPTTKQPDIEPTTAEPTTPAATEADQPAADPENADKVARTQALEAKVNDKTATAEDIKALRELKADPAQHRADLEQKALDGTITDEEADELGKLNASEATSSQTPEQQAEELMEREGLAGISDESKQQIQEAFEKMFKDADKAREQDAAREREMKRLQREMKKLREQNKRLTDQVKELNSKLEAAGITEKQILGVTV
jgi:hypothetical protein